MARGYKGDNGGDWYNLKLKLLDDDKRTIKINIWKHKVGRSEQIPFSAPNTFAMEEEAIKQCFNFGKQIIDGQIKLHRG